MTADSTYPDDGHERVEKAEFLRVLRRAGLGEIAAELDTVLPDIVDLRGDEHLWLRYGVDRNALISLMGGSP